MSVRYIAIFLLLALLLLIVEVRLDLARTNSSTDVLASPISGAGASIFVEDSEKANQNNDRAVTEAGHVDSALLASAREAAEYVNLLSKADRDDLPLVVVAFANDKYRAALVNWMARLVQLQVNNFLVVCTDRALSEFMSAIGRPCVELRSTSLSDLWLRRVTIVVELLNAGISVVLSDVDALWVKNALPRLTGSDILMSRGSFPQGVFRTLGAAGCMGFAYFRAKANVIGFMQREVLEKRDLHLNFDDQVAFNLGLIYSGVHFPKKLRYGIHGDQEDVQGYIARYNMTISMLGHSSFRRVCSQSQSLEDVIVLHCFSLKTGRAKEQSVQEQGLWILKSAWKDLPLQSSFPAWIEAVTEQQAQRFKPPGVISSKARS